MQMMNFWDFEVWGLFNILAVLLLSLLFANVLKRKIKFLKNSLIPTSVLGGLILLAISAVFEFITGDIMFNTTFFQGEEAKVNGMSVLEVITYHALALGFIASTLKTGKGKLTKKRSVEVFNTGVTTVSTYLLQAVVGLTITIVAGFILKEFFSAAGILLPFGYGQGTGQALNFGSAYEKEYGFVGGSSFGLTVAAMGFLSASIGGVIYLNIIKKKRKINAASDVASRLSENAIQDEGEIPMNGSMDKMTVQIAFVALTYFLTNLLMFGLTSLIGMHSVIYGFNFLFGVLAATLVKVIMDVLNKTKVVKRQYTNNFLLDRISNCCFDMMVVAGIAAIRLDALKDYWEVLLILGVAGLVITYAYNLFVARVLFRDYADEQFLMMYGMLTGTASTGVILLREIDGDFKTPVADNLVYQNFPAMVFGFPIMLLANKFVPENPVLSLAVLGVFFLVMNIILFRSKIFKKKK